MCLFAEIRGSAAPPETAPTLQASHLLRQGAKLWLGGGQRSVTHSRICYSDVVKSRLYFLCFGEIRSSCRHYGKTGWKLQPLLKMDVYHELYFSLMLTGIFQTSDWSAGSYFMSVLCSRLGLQLYCLHNTEHTQVTLCIHKHTCSLCWRAHTTWPWVAGQSPIICVLTEFVIFFWAFAVSDQPISQRQHVTTELWLGGGGGKGWTLCVMLCGLGSQRNCWGMVRPGNFPLSSECHSQRKVWSLTSCLPLVCSKALQQQCNEAEDLAACTRLNRFR